MSDINPREIGELTQRVAHLERQVDEMRSETRRLIELVERARGGWQAIMIGASVAGAIGALLAKVTGGWAPWAR